MKLILNVKKIFYRSPVFAIFLSIFLIFGSSAEGFAQKKNVFQSGERLVYKVKYGFVKLGTLIIETGDYLGNSKIKTRMKFWTADVPMLDSKDIVDDIVDTTGICLMRFEEHGHDGEKKLNRTFTYDVAGRSISYSDESVKNRITNDVRPFSDALTIFFNLRSWNGCHANYFFPLRSTAGEKLIKCCFSRTEEKQECPAFDDKDIPTYRVDGLADMGNSAPLGASGKFTAWITEDEASIPVRLDMSIAIGSISLVLSKAERANWQP